MRVSALTKTVQLASSQTLFECSLYWQRTTLLWRSKNAGKHIPANQQLYVNEAVWPKTTAWFLFLFARPEDGACSQSRLVCYFMFALSVLMVCCFMFVLSAFMVYYFMFVLSVLKVCHFLFLLSALMVYSFMFVLSVLMVYYFMFVLSVWNGCPKFSILL